MATFLGSYSDRDAAVRINAGRVEIIEAALVKRFTSRTLHPKFGIRAAIHGKPN